ncbi:MAG: (2Fe-2S)-binding protein [Nitrincola sp.]|nr:(2Fe-2S)-binding protein [Nitrincola sp.]
MHDKRYHLHYVFNGGSVMYVCICNGVTERDILQAIDDGAQSVRDLNRELQVGGCCGKCVSVARSVIRSRQDEMLLESCVNAAA